MSQLTKKSLFNPEVHQQCLDRIEKLTADSQPDWGKMTAAQMLAHCAEIQEVSNGNELKNSPFLAKLFRGMIRRMVVNDKPYPKNTKTHPQYLQTENREFGTEKQRLLAALQFFVSMDPTELEKINHALFGKMTLEEKGWSMYKHLDHHLTQFGV